jgi:outer membrane receptor protein involved in Fe transport
VNADDWKTSIGSVSPYAELDMAADEDRLHIIPGVRVEPYILTTSRKTPRVGEAPAIGSAAEDTVLEPRIAIRYALSPRMAVKAAFGMYHQAPQPEDLSAVFGTPTLGLSQAKHYLAGGAFKLTETLNVEVTGFLSQSQDLVARSTAESPGLAHALDQVGEGRSYGTQFLLRQEKIGRFFGWVSYSILRSERRAAPDRPWRLSDYDQSHVLTALGSYDLGLGFELGARVRFATGFPRTPVVGAYFDSLADRYQPIFGSQNSMRIPSFFSLDLRLAKRFKIGPSELEAYVDVQNVTNHKNPEEIVYNASFSKKDYITGQPILPVVGARWSW